MALRWDASTWVRLPGLLLGNSRANAAWIVLAAGLALSTLAFMGVRSLVERESRSDFELRVADAANAIERRIRSYDAVLYGLRGLFSANDSVSRMDFRHYVGSLDINSRYPGLGAITFARHITHADRPAFEARMKLASADFPGAGPLPTSIHPPGDREQYHVFEYVEPWQRKEMTTTLGRDMYAVDRFSPERKWAAEFARDTGQPATSGRPLSVPSLGTPPHLAVRLAVYKRGLPVETRAQRREAYMGSVGYAFSTHDIMREVLQPDTLRRLHIRIHDAGPADVEGEGTPPKADSLIFDSDKLIDSPPESRPPIRASVQYKKVRLDIAGRKLMLHFSNDSTAQASLLLVYGTLAAGVLVSLLLFGLFHSAIVGRQRALRTVAGVLHDMNQPLSALMTLSANAVLLLDRNRQGDVRGNLERIGQSVERMSRVVGQLRRFVRTGEIVLKTALVPDVVANSVQQVEPRATEKGVKLTAQPDLPPLRVLADPVQLEQVLLNLLNNAIDAVTECEDKRVEVLVSQSGDEVEIAVRDHGRGIPEHVMPKLFTPLFTSKAAGAGTGLGLALSRETIRNFGGTLEAANANADGGGALFRLTLPAC